MEKEKKKINKKKPTTTKKTTKKVVKKKTTTKKKNKGLAFTLIELLAVIIILGVLMLVAIPSVTNYINNSRKSAYVNTAKQYIKGATQLVNSGELDVYDTGVTYYIPSTCIPLETGGESPYGGKFDPAYIIVTYDNDSYNYYWMSRDENSMGVKKPTLGNELKVDSIETAVTKEDVKANMSIINRNTIVVLSDDCSFVKSNSKSERKLTTDNQVIDIDVSADNSDNYLMVGETYSDPNNNFLRTTIKKKEIERITFTNSLQGHTPNGSNCWDVSVGQTGATLLWATDSDNNGLYELTIGAEDGVIVTSGNRLFIDLINLKSFNGFEYFNTSKVTDMSLMFQDCDSITSLDLRTINTSNVTKMNQMFYDMDNLTSLNISTFDTSKVIDMSYMFRFSKILKVIDISSFNVDKLERYPYMFANCGLLETIYTSTSFQNKNYDDNVFIADYNLVGGRGTTYSANNDDSDYAHIDGGPSNPGYFSTK